MLPQVKTFSGWAGMLGVVPDRNLIRIALYVYSISIKYHGSAKPILKMRRKYCHEVQSCQKSKKVSGRMISLKTFSTSHLSPISLWWADNGGRIRIGPGGYLWVEPASSSEYVPRITRYCAGSSQNRW